jgi:hypothetical protein
MSTTKQVAFFQRSYGDKTKEINGTSYGGETIEDVIDNSGGAFYKENDPNGISDLSTSIDSSITSITGEFVDYTTNEPYTLVSQDFIGGRPPHR